MAGILDTNVISELIRIEPNKNVVHWIANADESQLYLTSTTVAEIARGVWRLPEGRRRASDTVPQGRCPRQLLDRSDADLRGKRGTTSEPIWAGRMTTRPEKCSFRWRTAGLGAPSFFMISLRRAKASSRPPRSAPGDTRRWSQGSLGAHRRALWRWSGDCKPCPAV